MCKKVTDAEAVWRPQMVWMALNYTIAPVACIYVADTLRLKKQRTKRAVGSAEEENPRMK